MLCRVDPLVIVSRSRCMRRNQSRRVPHEEAARRQEQLSSRHLLQAGGQGCVRRFQISPDHGFHRKSDSLASRDKAGVVTALVTGRRTELRRFQISPDHGFHRKCDSSSSKESAGVVAALVTGRRTELRRFQISPEFGFHRKSDSSSMRETVSAKTPLFAVQWSYTVWQTNLCEPG